MKYLKTFETLENFEFKRCDIIKRINMYNWVGDCNLFLVLEDSQFDFTNNKIKVFFIGQINAMGSREYINISVDEKDKIHYTTNNIELKFLVEKEKILLYDKINDRTINKELDLIKEKTGIDLRDLDEYQKWLIKKDTDKYNL